MWGNIINKHKVEWKVFSKYKLYNTKLKKILFNIMAKKI